MNPPVPGQPPVTFGAALHDHRIAAGVTQEQLAESSAVSVRAIRNLELGRTARPQRRSILLLANALGLGETARAALLRLARHPRTPASDGPSFAPDVGVPTPRTERAYPQRCELPADASTLVGRDGVLHQLCGYLADLVDRPASAPGGAVRLVTVTGPPGAGKSALVVRLARRLRDRFPDGQLYLDVADGGPEPMSRWAILARLLRSLGVADVPTSDEERAALLRAALHRRRLLLIIDNATSERQIRPLLATTTRSAIVVASRCRLTALHCGRHAQLGALSADEAVLMLAGLAGRGRIAAEPAQARTIVERCGRLPLAIHIAGTWLAARPRRGLRDLAALLADERGRLDHLRVGDLAVGSSIAVDHRRLDPSLRHALHALARSALTEFDPGQVAALLDVSRGAAEEIVEGLAHGNMISPVDRGGAYRLDHLVRLYARHEPDGAAAIHRLATTSARREFREVSAL